MRIEWRFVLAMMALCLCALWALLQRRRSSSLAQAWRTRSDNPLRASDYANLQRAGHGTHETLGDRRFTQGALLLFALMPLVFSIVMFLTLGGVAEQAGLSRAQALTLTKTMDRPLSASEAQAIQHVQLAIVSASFVPLMIVILIAVDAMDTHRRLCARVLVRLEQLGDKDLLVHADTASPPKAG